MSHLVWALPTALLETVEIWKRGICDLSLPSWHKKLALAGPCCWKRPGESAQCFVPSWCWVRSQVHRSCIQRGKKSRTISVISTRRSMVVMRQPGNVRQLCPSVTLWASNVGSGSVFWSLRRRALNPVLLWEQSRLLPLAWIWCWGSVKSTHSSRTEARGYRFQQRKRWDVPYLCVWKLEENQVRKLLEYSREAVGLYNGKEKDIWLFFIL